MPAVNIDVAGDLAISRDLEAKAVRVGAEAFGVVRRFGLILQQRIVSKAQGRPGPRRRTGDYIRSWNSITSSGVGGAKADVGTNAPQGRRLEFGFTGADALGRHYRQPPYPHVRPAMDEVEEPFFAAIDAIVSL